MHPLLNRYYMISCAYGFVRTIVYAPPMKDTDYITDRIAKTLAFTAMSPISTPLCICIDIKNLEHKLRKMPGDINRTPWY